MPTRVTYWTGVWDPAREALSKEVEWLRRELSPEAIVMSLSAVQSFGLSPGKRVLRLSGRHYPLLRALAPLVEPLGTVSHVFGAVDAWHLLRAVGRRPVVFTVAIPGTPLAQDVYARVSVFVAESEPLASELREAGIAPSRLRVVYPGVPLDRYAASPPPPGRFRLLFASSPANVAEFEARGVPLLVELARRMPDVDVVALWRDWDDQAPTRLALEALAAPPNFIVDRRTVSDMAAALAGMHAVVAPFATGFGKSAPNSLIEGLAAGRPVLCCPGVGIGRLVEAHGAGLVCERSAEGLAAAVGRIRDAWPVFASAARALAERHFDARLFVAEYGRIYAELAA